ncbi:glycyl-tRNA synthetase beta chain [Sulfobacillus thermosulfidooxidans DSM 9293]|uniref:Glycine--tRNA ligase beta subunit n=1 Tax=Sulfobacillus thermosulfidooxidans (strain DSM 9293 / VKM B-1269 / AT-1) TaxID=929705 RepID=A0A1W1W860_SULTA|nr:glycine--tRNA ligase subunit beta [Sulfobacillus thermosulfidooxidans]SMC02477.1 glycyl-tRNA synthetase beta chain [Sulfobacillus thermosulfidooxidans DSM 9293]
MIDYDISPDMRQVLVEVGVEEIPSQYLRDLVTNFGNLIVEELEAQRIVVRNVKALATPRRLVVMAQARKEQDPLRERIRGPLLASAYKDNMPTPALLGFCRRVGVSPGEVETMTEGDKVYVCVDIDQPIRPLEDLLAPAVEKAFSRIPLPRSMRWGSDDYRFIRPVRWCSLWIDDTFVPVTIAGVIGEPKTYGNRTDHPGALAIHSIASYEQALARGLVMLDADRRKQVIENEANDLADSVRGHIDRDEDLLEEVTELVEWPTPFLGHFDEAFLEVPAPIVVTSMRVHQRYFPVWSEQGTLLPYFVGVRNGIGNDLDSVRHGNEKVLRARLSDALYFYRADLHHPLSEHRPQLDRVIFHAKLGTYGDKIQRVHALFEATRDRWPLNNTQQEHFKTVIELYKADLLTQVVQEFPELQGIMGEIYARHEGLADDVATAIGEQYHPGFQGDHIPQSPMGQILVLLDRLDTVLEGAAHGLKPTGSEDPFGLRRAALAIGRILAESAIWQYPAYELFALAGQVLAVDKTAVDESYDLVMARLEHYLDEVHHIPEQRAHAILSVSLPWYTYQARLDFLTKIIHDPNWETVALAFKRIDRVIKDAHVPEMMPEWELPIEQTVWEATQNVLNHGGSMDEWWIAIQALSNAVDALFNAVLINDPDPAVRMRRASLLAYAREAYNRFFDLRQISV